MKKERVVNEYSSAEIKFNKIIITLGAIVILIIILVNIPWKGKQGSIAKQYEFLNNDHVFISVDANELMEIKEDLSSGTNLSFLEKNNEKDADNFYVYFGNNSLSDVDYFVYYTNQIAKNYKRNIYYLNTKKIKSEDLETIRELTFSDISFNVPTIAYFEKTTNDKNEVNFKAIRISSLDDFDEFYGSNYWLLLKDFFANCEK